MRYNSWLQRLWVHSEPSSSLALYGHGAFLDPYDFSELKLTLEPELAGYFDVHKHPWTISIKEPGEAGKP